MVLLNNHISKTKILEEKTAQNDSYKECNFSKKWQLSVICYGEINLKSINQKRDLVKLGRFNSSGVFLAWRKGWYIVAFFHFFTSVYFILFSVVSVLFETFLLGLYTEDLFQHRNRKILIQIKIIFIVSN